MASTDSVVYIFSDLIKREPEIFLLSEEGWVYHSGSSIFYDSENGAMGFFLDDNIPVIDDEEVDDLKKRISFIDVPPPSLERVHSSCMWWLSWNREKSKSKILDLADEFKGKV